VRWPRDTLYPLKLALISPTSCGRSVGKVRLRTKATEFSFRWMNVHLRKWKGEWREHKEEGEREEQFHTLFISIEKVCTNILSIQIFGYSVQNTSLMHAANCSRGPYNCRNLKFTILATFLRPCCRLSDTLSAKGYFASICTRYIIISSNIRAMFLLLNNFRMVTSRFRTRLINVRNRC
jgi:hypothetical protein